jgi:nucleoside 2-deoxyribosyltransferase
MGEKVNKAYFSAIKPGRYNPKIYCASKIWHAEKWLDLRNNYGYDIISSWIEVPCGTKDNPEGALKFSPEQQSVLWQDCVLEINRADLLIAYAEEGDDQRGALVEIGGALANSCPVYLIGNCDSYRKSNSSDAAFTHHPLFYNSFLPDDHIEGYKVALRHWHKEYE